MITKCIQALQLVLASQAFADPWCSSPLRSDMNTPIGCTDANLAILPVESSSYTIDYGGSIEGFPVFDIEVDQPCLLTVTYAEAAKSLLLPNSDGPMALAGAMETYRVQNYHVAGVSHVQSRRIQGAFRYQMFNLTGNCTATLRDIHVSSSVHGAPVSSLPGSFNCSNSVWTTIWHAGARTVQLTELPAGSVPDFYQVSDEGLLAESAAPIPYAEVAAQALTTYTLEFAAKIVNGGFSFKVLSDTLSNGVYIWVNYANNTISAHSGQTEKNLSIALEKLPSQVTNNTWVKVHATVNSTDIDVILDNQPVLSFVQDDYLYGSFGFGAAPGQSAYFQNITVSALNGDQIYYAATLRNQSSLQDYAAGTNQLNVSVDGSLRDRIAYAGDLDISARSGFASTSLPEFARGSLDLLSSFQLLPGFFVPTAKIQQPALTAPVPADTTGLIGYSFNLLLAMARYYDETADVEAAKVYASRAMAMLDWAESQCLSNGLLNISDPTFGGDWNYYDPNQFGVVSKFNVLFAYSLQEIQPMLQAAGHKTERYENKLISLRQAIAGNLYNRSLGAFYISENITDGFGQDTNATALLAGILNGTGFQEHGPVADAILDKLLKELSLPSGPFSFSNSTSVYGYAPKISPYASAYHLRAAFQFHHLPTINYLLGNLWGPMADTNNANYTGIFWEVLNPDGTPGLDTTTSLCHAWASAPTAELSQNILGIYAEAPGYQEWLVAPYRAGLEWANGSYRTPYRPITVHWAIDTKRECVQELTVNGPSESSGRMDSSGLLGNGITGMCPDQIATLNGKPAS